MSNEQVPSDTQVSSDTRLRREFIMISDGKDPEFDALGVCSQALAGLTKDECQRIAKYLLTRYGYGVIES